MKLYDYQLQYLSGMPQNVIMTAEVGLGKTPMSLEHARRHGITLPNRRLIVVAPASKVRTGDWQREIVKFFEPIALESGGKVPDYTVISYEMFTKKHKELVTPETTLIIDESHFICNATSLRSKAVLKAARVARQWILLSATPLPNGWRSAETYAILTGLSKHKTDFAGRFVIIDRSRGFPLFLGYREEGTLQAWWDGVSKPLKRTGAMHLPSQSIPVKMVMSAKERAQYRKALKERLYTASDGIEHMLDSPSKLFVTLRQIPLATRIDALKSIVESTDEHIVVFYNFDAERQAMLDLLKTSFKERKTYEQSGHRSDLPPRNKWADIKPSVTLVQYQSGSQAIELTYASVTVYLSPCTSYANYEQSKGRTRRNGQEKTTLFYHIAAEDSLDEHIWGILAKKRDFSTALFEKAIANS